MKNNLSKFIKYFLLVCFSLIALTNIVYSENMVVVNPKQVWTNTGVTINVGDTLVIFAQGYVSAWSGNKNIY